MLTIEQKIEFLTKIGFFKDCPNNSLMDVVSVTHEVHFRDNEDIFIEGEIGDAVYLIVKGQVMISAMGKLIAIRSDNEFFGEMAIIDDRPRSATATSRGNSVLLKIYRDDFYNIMQSNLSCMRNLLKALVGRLREDINIAVEAIRLKQDLVRAHELQVNIFPSGDLNFTSSNGSSIQVSGVCYPAETVGGDYYDYFQLSDSHVGIAIGDVMGHGFHSGLMVFTIKSCLNTQIISNYDITNVMSVLNNMVYRFVRSDMFMTFCYLIVDLDNHIISYCNAGHNYPYYYCNDTKQLVSIESGTYPMGISDILPCSKDTVKWNDGDMLVLYTDGITEAENSKGEEFGNKKLESLIVNNAYLPASVLRDLIIQELKNHCQSDVYKDDITLVVAKLGKRG